MAKGINKVTLVGNLGNDPDTRYMPNGNAVTSITLATGDSWKDKQTGQIHERTEWHRVVFFGKLAEIAGEYLNKGSQCYIEGRLQTRDYEKDGIKRYVTEIIVDINGKLLLMGGGTGNSGGNQQRHQQQARQPATRTQQQSRPQQQQPAPDYDSFDDDIPFADPYRGTRCLIQ